MELEHWQRVGVAGAVGSGRTGRHAHQERVALEALLATAVVRSRCVDAERVHAARVAHALVDVRALDVRVAAVTGRTDAVHAAAALLAGGALAARGGAAGARRGAAALVRVAGGALVADALIGLSILAVGVPGAGRLTHGRQSGCGEMIDYQHTSSNAQWLHPLNNEQGRAA